GRPPGRDSVVAPGLEDAVRQVQLRQACITRHALGIDGLDVELVAAAADVQADAAYDGEAVFVPRLHAGEGRVGGFDIVAVIAGRDLMDAGRELRGAPGLVDAELADEVRKLLGGVVADRAKIGRASCRERV